MVAINKQPKIQEPLSFQLLISLAVIIIILQNANAIALGFLGKYHLLYPDAYMRLVKVVQLLNQQQWFDHFIPTTNTPFGANLHHWTRALDSLLASGTLVLSYFMPMKKALWLWSFILPPLVKLIASILLISAFKPIIKSPWQTTFILAAFLFHPYIQTIYLPLRVDYNFITTTLFIGYVALFLHFIDKPSPAKGAYLGLVLALGSWVSLSFYIAAMLPLCFLIIQWITFATKSSKSLIVFFLTALVSLAAFILLESGQFIFLSFDIISLYYWLMLAITAFSVMVCTLVTQKSFSRLLLFTLLMSALFSLLFCYESQLIYGPYAAATTFLRQWLFPHIVEQASPFSVNKLFAWVLLANTLGGLSFLIYASQLSRCLSGLLVLCIPLAFLSMTMLRWNDYSQPIFILATAGWITISYQWLQKTRLQTEASKEIIMALLTFFGALMPVFLYQLHSSSALTQRQICLTEMMKFVTSNTFQHINHNTPLHLVVEPEIAPAILFYSHHKVVAGLYHPNATGLKDTLSFMMQPQTQAKTIAQKRHLDGILLCKNQSKLANDISQNSATHPSTPLLTPFLNNTKWPNIYFYRISQNTDETP